MNDLEKFGQPFWLDLKRPYFPKLGGDINADIVIIGAGISGLKLAHALAKRGISSVILEGAQAGEGASGRNQGSINVGPNTLYAETIEALRSTCGAHAQRYAHRLWQLGSLNLELMEAQMDELGINCDFQKEGFHMLARRDVEGWEMLLSGYKLDAQLMQKDGLKAEWMDESSAISRGGNSLYAGGLFYPKDSQFHSGKFAIGLAQGITRSRHIRLFENTRVLRIEQAGTSVNIVTTYGNVTAQHVFLLTNALVPQHIPALAPAMRAERGQVFVTEPLPQRPCRGSFGTAMAWWREIPEEDGRYRLLFGGGRVRDEPDSLFRQFDKQGNPHPKLESEGFSPSVMHQRRLDLEFKKLFPSLASARISHRWGGLQSFTADRLPLVGTFDPTRNIHGMAGFSGRGNSYSNIGAEFLADRVAGNKGMIEQQFGDLFEKLMAVNRISAKWSSWESSND